MTKVPPDADLKAEPLTPPVATQSAWQSVLEEEERVQPSLRPPITLGLATLAIGVGGFLLWAFTTDIAAASIAAGKVIVDSQTKTVTLFDGGTLAKLLVEEGDAVERDQVLARMDVTRSEARLNQLEQQIFALEVRLARLGAERSRLPSFEFREASSKTGRRARQEIIEAEEHLFLERTRSLSDLVSIDNALINQLQSQLTALEARLESTRKQAEVVEADSASLEKLLKRGLTTRSKFSERHLALLDLQNRVLETEAMITENTQKIAQAKLSIVNRETVYMREVAEAIQAARLELSQAREEKIAAQDIYNKAEIRAPQQGVVANIRFRTAGSAILGGQPILDIVPSNQTLLIEGKAKARDIDSIRVGESAEIHLSSFSASSFLPLKGKITYVAPDSTTDEHTGEVFYLIRASIPKEELQKQPDLFLYPGMSAEVYILNGTRTAIAYLTQPARDSFRKAFRED